jgi:hypothetical protein
MLRCDICKEELKDSAYQLENLTVCGLCSKIIGKNNEGLIA